VAALDANLSALRPLLDDSGKLRRTHAALESTQGRERVRDPGYQPQSMSRAAFSLLALAFLDARGYAERSKRKSELAFFADILRKYVSTVSRFQETWAAVSAPLGRASVSRGDARALELPENSIDGVLFSPPYSFAIDYLKNDASHLSYLGFDPAELRPGMVGLNARRGAAQVEAYFNDMALVLREAARVLRPGKRCSLVVGSNVNQLARALGRSPDDLEVRFGLEGRLIEIAEGSGLILEVAIRRLIVGMANSMREEHILIMRKGL
jgi:SAM-dependent methyltransferase